MKKQELADKFENCLANDEDTKTNITQIICTI